jgi:transcriptional regulator with XRE-family HTH domain
MSEQIVSKLRTLRAKRSLRILDLCIKTGVGMSTLAIADRGGPITERTARLLAPVLGVKPEDLMPEAKKRSA